MDYALGVDAGNTKTIALVARLDGTIVGSGRSGCGDIYSPPGAEAALEAVETAVTIALCAAAIQREGLTAGCFSMAGADWPEDFAFLERSLEQRGLGRTIRVVNDAIGALRAGSRDGVGVSVVCGTGVATGARASDGRLWHSSFWQEPQGSRHLGQKTLQAIYRAELGIDPPTSLADRVLSFLELASVEEILHAFTARDSRPPLDIARLAHILLDEAGAGDASARQIVLQHGSGLGDYALVAARRVGLEGTPFTLVLSGGVLRHSSTLLRDALVARVRSKSPGVQAVTGGFEPAVGALFMALEVVGVSIDEQVLARLTVSLPPTELFAT